MLKRAATCRCGPTSTCVEIEQFNTWRTDFVGESTVGLGTSQGENIVERVLLWQEQTGRSVDHWGCSTVVMNWNRIARTYDAKTSAAQVFRTLDDMFSKTPKGSFMEWYTDLYNLEAKCSDWWIHVMPDVIACGMKARLMRDPSLARLEGRVKRATYNLIYPPARQRFLDHIESSFAKAACRTRALAWKTFEKSSEARALPSDVLDKISSALRGVHFFH
ncbi:g1139 [Coccomyxa elongata]